MIGVEIEGFGVVREPGQAPYPSYVISVSQPTHAATWTVYRRPAAFRALSDRLREILPSLRPCPEVGWGGWVGWVGFV